MKKIIKIIFIILIILFLSLYFSKYNTEYYENKYNLTTEAIKKYENDLKSGKSIDPKNYIIQEKNYDNKVSLLGIKTSKMIEKTFSKGLEFLMKYLENSRK